MRIAVNLIPLEGLQGIETFAENVIQAIAEKYPDVELFLILHKNSPHFFKEFSYAQVKNFFLSTPRLGKLSEVIMQQFCIYPLLRELKPDLLFSPSPFMPAFFNRNVVVIHDCAYDRFREELPNTWRRVFIRGTYFLAKLRALKIITVSEFSKRELIELYKINPDRIDVIYEAAPKLPMVTDEVQQKTLKKFSLGDSPYFFYVGNMRPRKNLPRMIEAFRLFSENYPGYKFVIAGKIDKRFSEPLQVVEEAGIKDRVIFTGFVTQEEKVALYKGSLSLFFCSLYEGFGLPVLESQSLGVPVITSSASSLPEVAGSGALYADPLDAENMAKRLEAIVLNDKLRAELTQKGFENLNRFSWEKTAENLFSIFHGLVHSGSSC